MGVLLVERSGKYLVRKRSDEERWLQGLWEFPSAEGENFGAALRKLEISWKASADRQAFLEVKHQITHHKIRLRFYRAKATPRKPPKGGRWATLSQLETLPFSSAQVKLRDWLRKHSFTK
jgi:adenine-specific DNA glycosylase